MRRMTRRTFLPAINGYASEVAASIERYKTVSPGAKVGTQEKLLANLLDSIEQIDTLVCALDDAGKQALEIENLQKRADFYAHTLIPIMDDLRSVVDYTETITDRTYLASAELQQHVVLRLGFYDKGKQTRLPEETEREEQTSLLFPPFWV